MRQLLQWLLIPLSQPQSRSHCSIILAGDPSPSDSHQAFILPLLRVRPSPFVTLSISSGDGWKKDVFSLKVLEHHHPVGKEIHDRKEGPPPLHKQDPSDLPRSHPAAAIHHGHHPRSRPSQWHAPTVPASPPDPSFLLRLRSSSVIHLAAGSRTRVLMRCGGRTQTSVDPASTQCLEAEHFGSPNSRSLCFSYSA